jgi:hypothetical protein
MISQFGGITAARCSAQAGLGSKAETFLERRASTAVNRPDIGADIHGDLVGGEQLSRRHHLLLGRPQRRVPQDPVGVHHAWREHGSHRLA